VLDTDGIQQRQHIALSAALACIHLSHGIQASRRIEQLEVNPHQRRSCAIPSIKTNMDDLELFRLLVE
jgi:hypothetical protein